MDARLRNTVDSRLESSAVEENIKNIVMKLLMIRLHMLICVQLDSLVSKRSCRKACANYKMSVTCS